MARSSSSVCTKEWQHLPFVVAYDFFRSTQALSCEGVPSKSRPKTFCGMWLALESLAERVSTYPFVPVAASLSTGCDVGEVSLEAVIYPRAGQGCAPWWSSFGPVLQVTSEIASAPTVA